MTPWKHVPDIEALGLRFRQGESIRALARETGIEYGLLRRRFESLGYRAERIRPLGGDLSGFIPVPKNDPLLAKLRKVHPGVRA